MNQPPPTLAQLRLAPRALAKVQTIELDSWGASTNALIGRIIEEYQQLEAAYIESMVGVRSEHAADKQGKDRRLRPTV